MKERLYHEKYIMRRSKEGSVKIVIITGGFLVVILLPLFLFFINISLTQFHFRNLKEALDISLIAVCTQVNRDRIAGGHFEMEEEKARLVFYQEFDAAIQRIATPEIITYPEFNMTQDRIKAVLNGRLSFTGVYNKNMMVESSMELMLDPVVEGKS
jgi:hypothetical protein